MNCDPRDATRTRISGSNWHLKAFAAAALALSFAAPTSAQFTNQSGISGAYFNLGCAPSSGLSTCGFTGSANSFLALSAAASAYGDAFGLHAKATISETVLSDVSVLDILETAGAGSTLQDTFTFVGPHPQFAEVAFTVTTHGFSVGQSFANTQLDIGDGVDALAVRECIVHDSGTCTAHGLVNLNLNYLSLILHLSVSASADLRGTLAAGSTSSGQALYYDTASITNLSFSDTSGRPLDIHYVSASGLTYPMTAALPVPEPETFALLIGGFGALALGAKRRKGHVRP